MAEGTQYFSQLEKLLFTELVRKYKDLVQNKKNNYKTIQQKNKACEALSEQFNSPSGAMEPSKNSYSFCGLISTPHFEFEIASTIFKYANYHSRKIQQEYYALNNSMAI